MQIGKLNLGPLTAPFFGTKQDTGNTVPGAAGATAAEAPDGSLAQSATYRQILADYDVTHITPQQFSQMIRELHTAGAINDEELRELASLRFELDRAEVRPDEEVNLLDLFGQRLKSLQDSSTAAATGMETDNQSPDAREQAMKLAERQMEWLKKFAAIQSEGSATPLNTIA